GAAGATGPADVTECRLDSLYGPCYRGDVAGRSAIGLEPRQQRGELGERGEEVLYRAIVYVEHDALQLLLGDREEPGPGESAFGHGITRGRMASAYQRTGARLRRTRYLSPHSRPASWRDSRTNAA